MLGLALVEEAVHATRLAVLRVPTEAEDLELNRLAPEAERFVAAPQIQINGRAPALPDQCP